MKRYFTVCFLIFGMFSVGYAQKLAYGGKPTVGVKTENMESYFVKFPAGISVHKVRNDGEDRQYYFEIKKGTETLGKIDADFNAFGSTTDNFFAFWGDLDKNKSKELVIVDFNGQSNGLGVNYYTVNIFPDFETKGFTEPLTFNDSEFGKDGTFVYDAKTKETLILHTEWGGVEIKDSKRGDGLYFTGRFFRYENGKLKPAAGKPILARRYLNSFENERYRTEKSPLRPYNWLSSPTAIRIAADPIFAVKPQSTQSGIIEKVENVTETYKTDDGETKTANTRQMIVRLNSGETKVLVLRKDADYALPSDATKIFPEKFGLLTAKMTLPSDFTPFTIFDKLEGKKVQINSYGIEGENQPVYRLWFED